MLNRVCYRVMQIVELLKEFINSGDTNEARRCLLELEVPHFHHELVYQVHLPPCWNLFVVHDASLVIITDGTKLPTHAISIAANM